MTIPVLQKPTIHQAPTIKLIEYPEPQVVTLEQFTYFYEACEAYSVAGQEGFHTTEEVSEMFIGLTELDACGFAVYGLPTHAWLNMEQDIATATAGIEILRSLLKSANRQLTEQYDIINKSTDEIKDTLEKR